VNLILGHPSSHSPETPVGISHRVRCIFIEQQTKDQSLKAVQRPYLKENTSNDKSNRQDERRGVLATIVHHSGRHAINRKVCLIPLKDI
jgi:hypothetical protein